MMRVREYRQRPGKANERFQAMHSFILVQCPFRYRKALPYSKYRYNTSTSRYHTYHHRYYEHLLPRLHVPEYHINPAVPPTDVLCSHRYPPTPPMPQTKKTNKNDVAHQKYSRASIRDLWLARNDVPNFPETATFTLRRQPCSSAHSKKDILSDR